MQHTSLVFDNKMWIIGGCLTMMGSILANDVWYSTDGKNWTCATNSAQWSKRDSHRSVVFDNKMWIVGGYVQAPPYGVGPARDVWYSSDGITWNCAVDSAQWSKRCGFTLVAFSGKMWLLGGEDEEDNALNEVWSSTDGATWVHEPENAEWTGRRNHTSVVFDNKIWIMGGLSDTSQNDVWHYEGATNADEGGDEAENHFSSLNVENVTGFAGVRISYTLSKPAFTGLGVYTAFGRKIKMLSHGMRNAGFHEIIWDGSCSSGKAASAGVYFIRLDVDNRRQVGKVLLWR